MFALSSPQGSGAVTVAVDDSAFRNAYGGDYASRLHLVRPTVPRSRSRRFRSATK